MGWDTSRQALGPSIGDVILGNCSECGGELSVVAGRDDVRECCECGHTVATEKSTDAWDAHYATDAGGRHWPNEELVRFLSGRRFERALDVGCGTGSNLPLLGMHADRVHCCEPNERARTAVQEMLRGDCPWGDFLRRRFGIVYPPSSASVDDTRFMSEHFDLVVDCMVSQHIPWAEHGAVYREYARVLKPGGWLWLYHLDSRTRSAVMEGDDWDYSHLSLFPTVNLFCLPRAALLHSMVLESGFTVEQRTGLAREYGNGDVAHYTILAAKKVEAK